MLNACEFGVPQLRPRFILVAMRPDAYPHFEWPNAIGTPPTVGEALHAMMAEGGWTGADEWARKANGVGPTLVGGSRKHGGPDLGPTRAREAWRKLGVDGRGLADAPPPADAPVDYIPRLTRDMAAVIQGFPLDWKFYGRKTASYRQVGNAFPPPVARAVGDQDPHGDRGGARSWQAGPTACRLSLRASSPSRSAALLLRDDGRVYVLGPGRRLDQPVVDPDPGALPARLPDFVVPSEQPEFPGPLLVVGLVLLGTGHDPDEFAGHPLVLAGPAAARRSVAGARRSSRRA